MKKQLSLILLLMASQAQAIVPFEKLLELNNSIVVVNVDFPDGSSGSGTAKKILIRPRQGKPSTGGA